MHILCNLRCVWYMNREAAVHTRRYIGIYRDISDNKTELGKTCIYICVFYLSKTVINAQLGDSTRKLNLCTILHYYKCRKLTIWLYWYFLSRLCSDNYQVVVLSDVVLVQFSDHRWNCAFVQFCSSAELLNFFWQNHGFPANIWSFSQPTIVLVEKF